MVTDAEFIFWIILGVVGVIGFLGLFLYAKTNEEYYVSDSTLERLNREDY